MYDFYITMNIRLNVVLLNMLNRIKSIAICLWLFFMYIFELSASFCPYIKYIDYNIYKRMFALVLKSFAMGW